MKIKLLLRIVILLCFIPASSFAQVACGDLFTDPAGPNANYDNDSDYTVTIYPTNPGEIVTVTFTTFNTEITWDALYVFDGNSINAPQIPSTNPAGNVPGGLSGGYWGTTIPGPFTSSSADGSLTFRFRSDSSGNNLGWVANVACITPSSCLQPTNPLPSFITSNSATLRWTDNAGASSWEVLALPCGSAAPTASSTGTIVTTNPAVLTGLSSNTCYDLYVRALCDATNSSNWTVSTPITTLIGPPVCGGQFIDNGGVAGNYANSSDTTTTICPVTAGDKVTVTFTSFNTEASWDALYVFNGNSIGAPQIASTNAAANVPGGLAGGYWGTTIPGPFTSSSIDGCLTFRFRSDTTANRAGWVANVTCAPPPTCPKPTALTVTQITATSATVGWIENGSATSWDCLLLPNGSPAPTANTTGYISSTSNPFVITGLTPATCYTVYVRSNCSLTDLSDWSLGYNFCTLTAPPACGGNFVDNGGATANYTNSADVTTTICPSNPGDLVTVTFTSFDVEATWDALYVFDGATIGSPQITSTNLAGNVPGGLAGGYWGTTIPGPFTSSSPDGCLTFRFRSDTTANRAGWVANVTCAPAPTCPRPSQLTTNSITTTTANVTWTNTGNATQWEYIIQASGSPAPTANATGTITSTFPISITGLVPNTCYTAYVRAICSPTEVSDWSTGANFCTLIAPPVCGGQFVDNGGAGNYTNNSDNTYTVCPTNSGEAVTVVFTSFDVETNYDALYVFDGNSIAAPQIASTNLAANVPGGLAGGYWGTTVPGPFTSTSADGCLTFRFRSDNTAVRAGWNATVTCAPGADKILLVAFADQNNNGIKDTGENLFSNGSFVYQINDSGTNVNGYSPSGQYAIYETNPANSYDFSYEIQPEYAAYYSVGTTVYNNITVAVGSGTQVLYFPLTLTQTYNDLSVSIAPLSAPRPGLTYQNKIVYKNTGLTAASGTITFVKPGPVTITTISQTGTVANVGGFTYAFTNLLPNETRTITVTMTVPAAPTVNANDVLTDSASITVLSDDINAFNNTSSNTQIVVNSWDPNDKMESHGDKIPFNTFSQNDYLYYTIRFQNNGTSYAIDINIQDLLNAKIDPLSVRMVSASHNYVMNRVGNQLTWNFKNIYLPPSSVNLTGSSGFVQFRVKLNPGFQAGDIIPNNAAIIFDTNPAITTNTFNIKFTTPLSTASFNTGSLRVYPNPASTVIQVNVVDSTEKIASVVLYDMLGKAVKDTNTEATSNMTLDVSDIAKGVYLMEITSESHLKVTKKVIIE